MSSPHWLTKDNDRDTTMLEEVRYQYHLNANSIVLDIGAFKGIFATGISNRYHCWIHCFEPVRQYYEELYQLHLPSKVILHDYGVGPRTESAQIHVAGDRSSVILVSEQCETITIRSISEIWGDLSLSIVDLVKINIEGMEYDLLDNIIERGLHTRMRNIQVQFHEIPDYEARLAGIRAVLQKTHRQTYCWHMIWENWELM